MFLTCSNTCLCKLRQLGTVSTLQFLHLMRITYIKLLVFSNTNEIFIDGSHTSFIGQISLQFTLK